jgi:GNAT superfamily N-acetyltransferase
MEIRELKEKELDDLLALYGHLHASDEPLPARVIVENVWLEIHRNPNFQYYGGFIDGFLVAACTLTISPNLTRGCRPYGVIENVVTHERFRRQGFGLALLQHVLDQAGYHNCYKVMLMTGRKTEPVYRFYEAAGFDRTAKQAFLAKPPEQGHCS